MILSNPNNPTGTLISRDAVRRILSEVDAMILLDKAYIEFSDLGEMEETASFPNLLVLRTFSKGLALARIRLGYMIGQADTLEWIHRVRLPFNLSSLAQEAGLKALPMVRSPGRISKSSGQNAAG